MNDTTATSVGTGEGNVMERRLLDMALETYPYMVIAFFGVIARACRFGWQGFGQFCAASVVAAFSGVICSLALHDLGVSEGIVAAVAGIAGYSGGAVLDALLGGAIRKIHRHANGGAPETGTGGNNGDVDGESGAP